MYLRTYLRTYLLTLYLRLLLDVLPRNGTSWSAHNLVGTFDQEAQAGSTKVRRAMVDMSVCDTKPLDSKNSVSERLRLRSARDV